MLQSMTGYGKGTCECGNKKIVVELRSLNSKQIDINTRIIPQFREKELEIRNIITQQLERGKVDCAIYYDASVNNIETNFTPINIDALNYYHDVIMENATINNWNIDNQNWLSALLHLPDVIKPNEQTTLSNEEWQAVCNALNGAIEGLKSFRKQEGLALQKMFEQKLNDISELLKEVEKYEPERIEKIRQRIEDNLLLLKQQTQQDIDKNRLEQEMIFYLEKLDVTEEKVRLRNHIQYFKQTMQEDASVGKKLGFVAQEMGREINTLGSKSNHSEMQIIVVKMKDILEQIKEQVLNVL
ncbi:MAG: YicC family protein [Paludibacteraceae bacterium]|nr:YicC family protein [Paludibacteraceae bacterium]